MTTLAEMSLYQRLGGYNAIAAVVKDLYGRMLNDSHVWYYWKGRSTDSKATECRRFTDLVCANGGDSDVSRCRNGETTYTGLRISGLEWGFFLK